MFCSGSDKAIKRVILGSISDLITVIFPSGVRNLLRQSFKEVFIIPTLFRKSVGDIVITSIRLSVRYVISSQTDGQNPTKFGERPAYTSGACKSMFIFGPVSRGPGEGSKDQILIISNFKVNFKDFYAKMCTYTQ